jgi:hypothetical protein
MYQVYNISQNNEKRRKNYLFNWSSIHCNTRHGAVFSLVRFMKDTHDALRNKFRCEGVLVRDMYLEHILSCLNNPNTSLHVKIYLQEELTYRKNISNGV